MTKRPPHRNFFAPVRVDMAKRRSASPEGHYTEVTLVNRFASKPQKIQNSDSEFFVNSQHRMRLASSSVDKGKLGSGVVDTEELVCRSDHVNFVGLSFGAFLIEICKDRLVIGTVLQDHGHHLNQGLAQ